MSIAASRWAWRQRDVSSTAKYCLVALCDFADEQGESCWPGQRLLAEMTGLGLRTVARALRELEAAHKIVRSHRRRAGQFISDRYRIYCNSSPCDNQPDDTQPDDCVASGEAPPCATESPGPCATESPGARYKDDPPEIDPPQKLRVICTRPKSRARPTSSPDDFALTHALASNQTRAPTAPDKTRWSPQWADVKRYYAIADAKEKHAQRETGDLDYFQSQSDLAGANS